MENTPRLSHTLVDVFSQHPNWRDRRHLKTLAWRVVGLIQSGTISLTAWTPSVDSRAVYAQSIVRRLARWLGHDRIDVHALDGPLRPHALADWGQHLLSLALDPSPLWNPYGVVRLSLVYRGRAVPLVWKVLEQASSRVADDLYQDVLDQVAELLPCQSTVVLTADRGFADPRLMAHLARLGWHWRIRITGSLWIDRDGQRRCKVNRIHLPAGKARFWHHVYMTTQRYGPVHLALARCHDGKDYWFVVSDEPTDVTTFEESGWRFDIEEKCLDATSHGFQLASSWIRSAAALERLCWVMAITTRSLVAQGTEVVQQGTRRWVDPPWCRGQSYLKIGWKWVTLALSRRDKLVTRVS